jgi:hypothetical protein
MVEQGDELFSGGRRDLVGAHEVGDVIDGFIDYEELIVTDFLSANGACGLGHRALD